ncbi:MAG: sugar kinase [Candidatus Marinimicrobia bacterium]|nr:sugar kinase [Candidatus Neomarinimicrobiota bacterium]
MNLIVSKQDRKKVITFGEIMLRLAPNNFERIIQAKQFQAIYGGGEANVAISLALFGEETYFVSRIPNNLVGDAAVNSLRSFGVLTDYILRGGQRIGIYFLEHGASIRPSKVVYDRAGSAVSMLEPGMIDWKNILHEMTWFHITGITPALSPSCAAASIEALKIAKTLGLTVSCDLNYRKKLWSRNEAAKVMSELIQFVDVIISNEEDAADVFGIHAKNNDVTNGNLSVEGYRIVAEQLMDRSSAKLIAITLRESLSASDNNWSAILYDGENLYNSRKYSIHIVDRIGGGDSFGAGLIHGLINGWKRQDTLDFAVAASALKQTILGDFNLVNENDVMEVVNGNLSGRVQR